MKLRDFIKETMTEIAFGIQSAKLETAELWAINPGSLSGEKVTEKSYVEFDVAVTVTQVDEKQKDGSGNLKGEINVLGAHVGGGLFGGGKMRMESSTANVSRVTFKVPVYMNAHFRGDKNILEEAQHFAKLTQG